MDDLSSLDVSHVEIKGTMIIAIHSNLGTALFVLLKPHPDPFQRHLAIKLPEMSVLIWFCKKEKNMTGRMHKNLKYKNTLLYQPLTKIRRQWSEMWREQVTFSNPPNRISIEKVQWRECFLIGLRNGLRLYHVTLNSHDEDVEMDEYPSSLST